MSDIALYQKYRPRRFQDVVGQSTATTGLRNAISDRNTTHAYLFHGPAGTGKTTCARIFAAAVNCVDPQDGEPCQECGYCLPIFQSGEFTGVVYEINAASNRGIDAVRDVIVGLDTGSLGNKKVYIWDEAHSLTMDACNALLKVLEEPPPDVIFVLATTHPDKLPPTILSRVTKIAFRAITTEVLHDLAVRVNDEEGLGLTADTINSVVHSGSGSARDMLSAMESAKMGIVSDLRGGLLDIVEAVQGRDVASILVRVAELEAAGNLDPRYIAKGLLGFYRDALVRQANSSLVFPAPDILHLLDKEAQERPSDLIARVETMSRCLADMRNTSDRIVLEATLCRIATPAVDSSDLSSALDEIRSMIRDISLRLEAPSTWPPESSPADHSDVESHKPTRSRRHSIQRTEEPVPELAEVREEPEPEVEPVSSTVELSDNELDRRYDEFIQSSSAKGRAFQTLQRAKVDVVDGVVQVVVNRALADAIIEELNAAFDNNVEVIVEGRDRG